MPGSEEEIKSEVGEEQEPEEASASEETADPESLLPSENGEESAEETEEGEVLRALTLSLPKPKRPNVWLVAGACLLLIGISFSLLPRSKGKPTAPPAPPPVKTPVPPRYPDPIGIVLHDSDSPAVWHGVAINARSLERIHAHDHPHWATLFEGKTYHIGYHYVILPSGKIEKGRPDHCVGTHAKKHNNWLGICVVGAFARAPRFQPSKPTRAQVLSVISLCEQLMKKYRIPLERVKRHRDVWFTDCPGERFPYKFVVRQLKEASPTRAAQKPVREPKRG